MLAIDDNVSSNYPGDIFSNSDNYPTLSHMLSTSSTQPSPSMQQSSPTVQQQATANCHISVASSQDLPPTISTQQRQNLHTLGKCVSFNIAQTWPTSCSITDPQSACAHLSTQLLCSTRQPVIWFNSFPHLYVQNLEFPTSSHQTITIDLHIRLKTHYFQSAYPTP